jgi:hypothetical protein
MQAIEKGDFSRKFFIDLKGKPLELKTTINSLVDLLNCFASEVTHMLQSIRTEGRFGNTIETAEKHFEGAWLDMVENANAMTASVDGEFFFPLSLQVLTNLFQSNSKPSILLCQ